MEIEFISKRGRYFLELDGQPVLTSDALDDLCAIRFGLVQGLGIDLMNQWIAKYVR